MYKVLIADDEDIIRRGIARMIQTDPELEVVAQAEDGEVALELARQTLPDLLLVDINMPFMNGLEFIEQLRSVLFDPVILVVSGYDDFDYAQKALRLGVYDYLLKPIMEKPFFQAIGQAKQALSQRRSSARYLEGARMQLERNREALIASFLNDWLCNRFTDTEAVDQMRYLGVELPSQCALTVAHITADESRFAPGEMWDDTLLFYAAENIAREIFGFCTVLTCTNASNDLVILGGEDDARAAQAAEHLCQLLEQHLPAHVQMARTLCRDLAGLPACYDELLDQLRAQEKIPPVVLEAQHYIETHYGDEELSLQTVAKQLHISPQHLSRVFRHENGITFVDYITRVRIRHAMEMLEDDQMKVYEIAERTGYSSQHYFSNAFKKMLGVGPTEYRRARKK